MLENYKTIKTVGVMTLNITTLSIALRQYETQDKNIQHYVTTMPMLCAYISKEKQVAQVLLCACYWAASCKAFLQWKLSVITRQTRQAVRAINHSIFLICLWLVVALKSIMLSVIFQSVFMLNVVAAAGNNSEII